MGRRFIWHWRLGLAIGALGFCGCPSIAVPSLLHPGPAAYQRDVAEIFDPYPAPEVAHSSDQVRPPGFMQPMSEIKRARLLPRQSITNRPRLPNYNGGGVAPPVAPVDTSARPVSFY